jgi:hypothetical protein
MPTLSDVFTTGQSGQGINGVERRSGVATCDSAVAPDERGRKSQHGPRPERSDDIDHTNPEERHSGSRESMAMTATDPAQPVMRWISQNAAGDVRAESGKRVASAVGEVALAVMLVHRCRSGQ